MKSNVIDQPAKAGEDQLHMNAYAEALTEFIRDAQSPLTIALQGEWGSGKTSLMNAID
jgi:tRNA A37 threonylcarbamoyladenosine biosynthesis protein TsaE